MFKILKFGFLVGSLVLSVFAFADMDRDDPQAKSDNAEILKAIVKIQGNGNCTATLVSERVLLTAAHCSDLVKEGESFTINGEEHRALKIRTPKGVDLKIYDEDPNTEKSAFSRQAIEAAWNGDIAFIQFEQKNPASILLGIKPVSIAKEKKSHSKSQGKVLIAGFGLTSQGDQEELSDGIRAGYNQFLINDYSAPKITRKNPFYSYLDFLSKKQVMIGTKERVGILLGKSGMGPFEISDALNVNRVAKADAKSSLPLPGDSGGPAISRTDVNEPEVVGVCSTIGTWLVGKPLVKVKTNRFEKSFVASDISFELLRDLLKSLGLLSESVPLNLARLYVLNQDVEVNAVQEVIQEAKYTSVFEPNNRAFIESTLKEFQASTQ